MLRLTKANAPKQISKALLLVALLASQVGTVLGQPQVNGLRGMAVVPVMFRQPARAGTTITLPIGVTNLESGPISVQLEINPVTYQEWTYGPLLGKATKYDCSSWFAETKMTSSVPSREQKFFPLKCAIPKGTEPGAYYCLGTIVPTISGDNSVIRTQYQIPIILYVGAQPKADLKFGSPELTASTKENFVEVPFLNESKAFLVVGATVQVRDLTTNRLIAARSDSDRNLYPESHRKLHFTVPLLPDGRYRVQAVCQAGIRTFRPIIAEFIVKDNKSQPLTEKALLSLPPFVVDPGRLQVALPPNSRRSVAIKFTNVSDNPLTVSLTAHKLTQLPNGALQVLDDGPAPPLGLTLTPDSVSIEPKRTVTVRVVVNLDDGASGDNWFAISARTTNGDSMSEEVYGNARVPETLKVRYQPKLTITPKEVGTVNGIPISLDYEITNVGNIALQPHPSASVLEGGLTGVATLEVPPLGDGGILPGSTLHNRVMLPLNLKPGAYAVEISYQYTEDLFEKKLIPFTIPAPKPTTTPSKKKSGGGK